MVSVNFGVDIGGEDKTGPGAETGRSGHMKQKGRKAAGWLAGELARGLAGELAGELAGALVGELVDMYIGKGENHIFQSSPLMYVFPCSPTLPTL